jgi:DNA-binding transcriptional ArsR family regulator
VLTSRPSDAARRLLGETLNSFERLEIAIALHQAPAQTLLFSELVTKLKLSGSIVERGLDELAEVGAVHVAGDVVRLTLSPQDVPAMGEIVALYEDDRLLVVRTLTEIAMENIRGMAARTFADAFRLRRKKEEEEEEGDA